MVGAGGQLPDVGGVVPEVPGYRIERQLWRGSMGVVYLAEDVRLRRKVALKVLASALADDELFRRRFDRESQSAANLDHPNIVPVYAAGEAGGSLYIAMRYVGGAIYERCWRPTGRSASNRQPLWSRPWPMPLTPPMPRAWFLEMSNRRTS
jgi:serine/threonine protein kinase